MLFDREPGNRNLHRSACHYLLAHQNRRQTLEVCPSWSPKTRNNWRKTITFTKICNCWHAPCKTIRKKLNILHMIEETRFYPHPLQLPFSVLLSLPCWWADRQNMNWMNKETDDGLRNWSNSFLDPAANFFFLNFLLVRSTKLWFLIVWMAAEETQKILRGISLLMSR